MTENLKLELKANTDYTGSYNDGSTFTFNTGSACGSNGACIMNGNTTHNSSTNQWYYSWYAVAAGRGTASSTGDIDGSICPKGWKLPYIYAINSAKSPLALINTYSASSGAMIELTPLSFSRNGYYLNSGLRYNGTYGDYWLSTANDSANGAYVLSYNISEIYPQLNNYNDKYYGFQARCINI